MPHFAGGAVGGTGVNPPDYYETFETVSGTACQGLDLYGAFNTDPNCFEDGTGEIEEDETASEGDMPTEGLTYLKTTCPADGDDALLEFELDDTVSTVWVEFEWQLSDGSGLGNGESQWFFQAQGQYRPLYLACINSSGTFKIRTSYRNTSGYQSATQSSPSITADTAYTVRVMVDLPNDALRAEVEGTTVLNVTNADFDTYVSKIAVGNRDDTGTTGSTVVYAHDGVKIYFNDPGWGW